LDSAVRSWQTRLRKLFKLAKVLRTSMADLANSLDILWTQARRISHLYGSIYDIGIKIHTAA